MTAGAVLKQTFGYNEFRGGQETLINDILEGRDVLGIMPTGAGKSVCFQVPALMMDGITLIVSPLISLMKDQVSALCQSGVRAAFINSSLSPKQVDTALKRACEGLYKIIYVAPERLLSYDFLQFVQRANISMLTVDESHCISQWGHDFRPSYARIPEFINRLPNRPVISAFTATATPQVRDDIINLLGLIDPAVLKTGFDRPNLRFEVRHPRDKFTELLDFLNPRQTQSGIIYCNARKTVEEVCAGLKDCGYNASRYHAGLPDRERRDNQDDFIFDRVQIMVATNAFGMGIDKSNVSYVAHYNMPMNMEGYYQEAGRAGRDGSPADCLLLYSGQDVRTNTWLLENSRENEEIEDTEMKMKTLERNRARLKKMTFYSTTSDCLRGFILKYFGEVPPAYCGSCGNCDGDFEMVDITEETRMILSCVSQAKERFGAGMIVDIVRGGKSEKLLKWQLDKLPAYGMSRLPDRQLREIVRHLTASGYLNKTDDEYPVLKLGERAAEVLRGGSVEHMKQPKGKLVLKPKAAPRSEKATASRVVSRPVNMRLFAALRDVRRGIAEEQNLPAYVIFNDSTLMEMSAKYPATRDDLIGISGVGEIKADRYGKQFLEAIAEFMATASISEDTANQGGALRKYDPSVVEITDEPAIISVIADRINCALILSGFPKISGLRINNWLARQGILTVVTENGKNAKIPTSKGVDLGITSEERVIRGERTRLNLYGRLAQEIIAANAPDILALRDDCVQNAKSGQPSQPSHS